MGMYGMLAAAVFAVGVMRYLFRRSQVEADQNYQPVHNTSSSSNPSPRSNHYRTPSRNRVRNRNDNSRSSSNPSQGSDHYRTSSYNAPEDLIKKGIVPEVLKKALSPSSYKDYFSALLYAEDYYYEKWCDYKLRNVTLKLHKAAVNKKSDHKNKKVIGTEEKDDKTFVEFKMDDIPEKRPLLLSKDLVFARPSGSNIQAFHGIILVVNGNIVRAEFDDKFHSQHHSTKRYDISFSLDSVCLKSAHQALNSISDSLLENFLFPNSLTRKTTPTPSDTTIQRITAVQSSPPYLISSPRCASELKSAAHLRQPSLTVAIIQESVVQIYRTSPNCRILICSPSNSACDVLMFQALKRSIPESAIFRANVAFRERDDVPGDIEDECFSEDELRGFKVIFSTFVSCFRLHNEGLPEGHFSHIFMVDASSAIEPEALVVLANFAGENTAVIVAGEEGSSPSWVRSEIGRMNGLTVSYFERLKKLRPYLGLSPDFITELDYWK